MSYIDINREDSLWKWMREKENLGMKALAIPHNSMDDVQATIQERAWTWPIWFTP